MVEEDLAKRSISHHWSIPGDVLGHTGKLVLTVLKSIHVDCGWFKLGVYFLESGWISWTGTYFIVMHLCIPGIFGVANKCFWMSSAVWNWQCNSFKCLQVQQAGTKVADTIQCLWRILIRNEISALLSQISLAIKEFQGDWELKLRLLICSLFRKLNFADRCFAAHNAGYIMPV